MRDQQKYVRARAVLRSYPVMAVILIASVALANAGHLKSVVAGTAQEALSAFTQDYRGGRDFNSLAKHAQDNLA